MKFFKSILVFAFCISVTAQADIRTVVDAVEVNPLYVKVPANAGSRLSFKTCAECDSVTPRLTSITTFSVRGKAVKFADFRQGLISLKQRSNGYALIMINTETNTVASIDVTSVDETS